MRQCRLPAATSAGGLVDGPWAVCMSGHDDSRRAGSCRQIRSYSGGAIIMLSASFHGQGDCPVPTRTPRAVFGATLLLTLAAICSQTAFGKMEHLNRKMHWQQMHNQGSPPGPGSSSSPSSSAPPAPNPDCTLIVPSNP